MLPYPLRALFINDFEPKKNLYSHHFGDWKETVSEQTSFQYLWCFFFFDELFCFKFDFSFQWLSLCPQDTDNSACQGLPQQCLRCNPGFSVPLTMMKIFYFFGSFPLYIHYFFHCSVAKLQNFGTAWMAACQAPLSFTISWSQIHVYWVGDAI